MKLVSPERWYQIYWTLMGIAFLVAQYWVIRFAIVAANAEIERK